MKFEIVSFDEAITAVPKEKQSIGFINILIFFRRLIDKNPIEEKFFMDYIHSLARTINDVGDKYDAEIVDLNNDKMSKLARQKNLNPSKLKNFFCVVSEVIYKSRYETIGGKIIAGDELDLFEEYNERFNENAWLKKHGLIY